MNQHAGMMRTVAVVTLSALALAQPTMAHAGYFHTGNDLLNICTDQRYVQKGECIGLATAYYESMQMTHTCPKTSNITTGQIRDIAVKFLKDNPGERHLLAATLAYRAFYVAFDCKPKPNTNQP